MTSTLRLKINARLFFLVKVSAACCVAARPKKKVRTQKHPHPNFFKLKCIGQ